jgi:hypothetical protein
MRQAHVEGLHVEALAAGVDRRGRFNLDGSGEAGSRRGAPRRGPGCRRRGPLASTDAGRRRGRPTLRKLLVENLAAGVDRCGPRARATVVRQAHVEGLHVEALAAGVNRRGRFNLDGRGGADPR